MNLLSGVKSQGITLSQQVQRLQEQKRSLCLVEGFVLFYFFFLSGKEQRMDKILFGRHKIMFLMHF